MSKKSKHSKTSIFIISPSCKKIRNCTFSGHNNVTSITISKSVIKISGDAFDECNNLAHIKVVNENPYFKSINGILYNKKGTEIIRVPRGITGSIVIPNGVKSIKNHAFSGCNNLTNISIPESIIKISRGAFNECNNLVRIDVADENPNYKSIDDILYNKKGTEIIWIPCELIKNIDGILYNKKETEIIWVPNELTGSIVIPNGVKSIKNHAFSGCNNLTNISIPESIIKISRGAFNECNNLVRIDVADENPNYKSIDDGILYNKKGTEIIHVPKGLTGSIVILNGVTRIKDHVFSGCNNLTHISIPASVTEIGEESFKGCYHLTNIELHNVKKIGNRAFSGCNNLTHISIPESVTQIGSNAFEGCISLARIDVEPKNPNYKSKDGILYNKKGTEIIYVSKELDSIVIPNSVTRIKDHAFFDCNKLTKITIPESVIEIGEEAFKGCSCLTNIAIPNVEKIGKGAFDGCSNLNSMTIPKVIAVIAKKFLNKFSLKIKNVNIPDGISEIKDYTVSSYKYLTSITIPGSVTQIESNAFEGCISLARIDVEPKNPNYKSKDGILYNKKGTKILCIPRRIKGFVSIPGSVTQIGSNAFDDCINLAHIKVADENPNYKIQDGILYNKEGTEIIYVSKELDSIVIPNSVTRIKDHVFSGCNNLTHISIPESVIEIGEEAFKGCSKLVKVLYKGKVPTCGSNIYSDIHTSLTSYYLPSQKTSWRNSIKPDGKWQGKELRQEICESTLPRTPLRAPRGRL